MTSVLLASTGIKVQDEGKDKEGKGKEGKDKEGDKCRKEDKSEAGSRLKSVFEQVSSTLEEEHVKLQNIRHQLEKDQVGPKC